MKRIDLPAPLFFAWMVLTLVLMVQGLRLAADRQAGHEPVRPAVLGPGEDLEIEPDRSRLLFVDDAPHALAVYEELPQRRLLRWTETTAPVSAILLVPLEGLGPGNYLLAAPPGAVSAAGQEMDLPEQELQVRARFTILPD